MNALWASSITSDWLYIKTTFRLEWKLNSTEPFKQGCCVIHLCCKATLISVSVSMRTLSLSTFKCRQPVSILSDVTSWNSASANQSSASSYYCLWPVFFSSSFFYQHGARERERERDALHACWHHHRHNLISYLHPAPNHHKERLISWLHFQTMCCTFELRRAKK